jgi:hypothetical protein
MILSNMTLQNTILIAGAELFCQIELARLKVYTVPFLSVTRNLV